MADVDKKDSKSAEPKVVHRGRWLTIAGAVLAAGVVGALGYFAVQYFRDTAYQDERAFRVLGHIVGQFGNLQEAIAGSVQLAPRTTDCSVKAASEQHASYLRRLVLSGSLDLRSGQRDGGARVARDEVFKIDVSVPRRRFEIAHQASASNTCRLSLSGSLQDQVPIFITQMLFDKVAIATEQGTILATIPRGYDRSQRIVLHSAVDTDLFGGNVKGVLAEAARHEANDEQLPGSKEDKSDPADGFPVSATVYAEHIGGQPFRVFVLPFEPTRPTMVGDSPAPRLYLVGLKRQDVLASLNDAMGSGGALVVTLGVLLCVLAWPFMSLRFSSAQEAIGPTQLLAILLALILIPAVLATAGFSLWTRYKLMLWADQQAEIYAKRVEDALIKEIDDSIHILDSITRQLTEDEEIANPRDGKRFIASGSEENYACVPPHTKCKKVLWPVMPNDLPPDWSPLRSAAPLNADGTSEGFTLSFFRGVPPSRSLALQDREYYRAIMAGEEWEPGDLWEHKTQFASAGPAMPELSSPAAVEHRYVAQRLFNRTDAARALQITIPIESAEDGRIGLMTGDTRAYGLTAGLRVPLLRFAIMDQRNGAVVFHTNDQLSLAENLLVETENNSALRQAMDKRVSRWSRSRIFLDDHFSGRYVGTEHRFYHRAVAGAPWGLVIFYEMDQIDTIVLQTAVATLATYFGIVIIFGLALALIVIVLPERADIGLLKALWPKWSSREHYHWIGIALLALLAALAAVALGQLRRLDPYAVAAIVLLVVLVFALGLHALYVRTQRASGGVPSVTSYKRSYVACVFGVLSLVSAVPAVVIAIGYHDISLHAFLRDELLQATMDEEQRRRTLLRDEDRFNDRSTADIQRGLKLSQTLTVPGYGFDLTASVTPSWVLLDSSPAPWLFECGPPRLDRVRRWIWALSTSRQVQRPLASNERRVQEVAPRRELSAKEDDKCGTLAVRAFRRSDDGVLMSVALPSPSDKGVFADIPPCQRDTNGTVAPLCRDPELHTYYRVSDSVVLAGTTLGDALLVLLLSAHVSRRLFGVRIPFAGRFTPSTADSASVSELLDLELELVRLKKNGELQMTSKDAADWRAIKCGPIYERMWSSLTIEQQLLMYQLAHGRYANPANQAVIEELLSRGHLALAPWPRIVEPGFADFIRRVHPSEDLHALRYQTSHTPWSQWRTPILVVVVVVAGLLMWLAGSAMHILAGTLAGIATLFGSITQVTSFIHREKPPK